jgi:hypothetical protein
MTFRYTDHTDPASAHLEAEDDVFDDGTPALYIETSGPVRIPLDRVEEVVAGLRDAARAAARLAPTT